MIVYPTSYLINNSTRITSRSLGRGIMKASLSKNYSVLYKIDARRINRETDQLSYSACEVKLNNMMEYSGHTFRGVGLK